MHTKHRMTILQMETTLAVLGDRRRSVDLMVRGSFFNRVQMMNAAGPGACSWVARTIVAN